MGRIKNKDLYLLKYLPQATDYVIGSDEGNDGETVNFELGSLTALVQNYGQSDRIISGKAIWIPGTLSFYIQTIEYYLAGQFHSTDPITIVLDPADPSSARKDVIAVTIDEEVYVETGIPGDPSKPTLPNGTEYLELTFVDIAAGATIPTGASYETVYTNFLGEPTEWTTTENTGGLRIFPSNTVFPNSSPNCIFLELPQDGDTITFTNDVPFVLDPNDNLQFYIRTPLYASNGKPVTADFVPTYFKIKFYNGGVAVSNYITIYYPTSSFSQPDSYYPISVDLDSLTFSDTEYDRFDIEIYDAVFDFRIDDVGIVRNINDPLDGDFVPTGGYEGTGQDLYTLIYNHINDTTIHFTQAQISITESQISDLQAYLLTETDPIFNAHTVSNITDGTGRLTNDGVGGWSYDNNSYALASNLIIPNNEVVYGTGTGITSTPNFKWDGLGFLSIYNNVVDSNPNFHIGSDSTNKLEIVAAYNTGTNTLDRAEIRTSTTSAVPNDGKINFYVDDIHIVDVNDGGIRFEPTMAIWWTSLGGTSFEVISFDINRSLLINNNDEGDGGDIIFSTLTGTSPSVIIKKSGNVSIGNTNDTYKFDVTGNSKFRGTVEIDTINAATIDTDKFLVSDGSLIKFRTGAELLSDIGASSSSHNHTLDSLSNVTITTNSAGEILKWSGTAWINNTLAEAGIAATGDIQDWLRADVADIKTGGNLVFNDNIRIAFGSLSGESSLYSDATNTLFDLVSGDLLVRDTTTTRFTFGRTTGNFINAGTITSQGTGNSSFVGNVGIGTTSPQTAKLHLRVSNTAFGWTPYVGTSFLTERNGDNIVSIVGSITGTCEIWFGDTDAQARGRVRYENSTDNMEFWTSGTQKMQITDTGNVGIDTTTPLTKLHVQNASTTIAWSPTLGTAAIFESNTSSRSFINIVGNSAGQSELWFGNQTNEVRGRVRYEHTPDTMSFWAAAGQKAQISSSGNFSIGNTNNTYKLDVSGTGRFTGDVTATNFVLSSDERLKTFISPIQQNKININWKEFELKEDLGQKRYGVIAQELEVNHPEFVRTNEEGIKSVAYIDLLVAKIAELEQRLEKAGI